jgi:hypothetical protein
MYDSLEFRAILASYEMRNKLERVARENERLKKTAARYQKKLGKKLGEREAETRQKLTNRSCGGRHDDHQNQNVRIIPVVREEECDRTQKSADGQTLQSERETHGQRSEKTYATFQKFRSASEPR